jgi:glycosyltransferase involved in cell wall biosynthesis
MLILGEGPGRSGAAERIRERGLSAYAETVGWVEDPQEFAARAWAFVLSSDEEGFAQVLTEAMSVRCPVITTDAQGGGPRFVTDGGKYGVLVSRGDPVKLAEAMEGMLQPDVRARYSELGQQRSEAMSPAACGGALVEFISARFALGG